MSTSNSTKPMYRRKLALVIGNQNYSRPENRLRHPINDANDISVALRNMKFEVTKKSNLTYLEMISTIEKFSQKILNEDLVLFYFSGHGYEINGKNYLMHIDDHWIETDEDVENYGINLEDCIQQLTQINPSIITIFILDCCRLRCSKNNRRTNSDLNSMEVPSNSYIVFACSPDESASDGNIRERNGLFAKHLLKHINKPNKDINRLFRTVTNAVCIESKQTQKPRCINRLIQSDQLCLNQK